MTAYNVNMKCENCTFADSWGRGCELNLLLPVLLLIENKKCYLFKQKTSEQIAQQIKDLAKK